MVWKSSQFCVRCLWLVVGAICVLPVAGLGNSRGSDPNANAESAREVVMTFTRSFDYLDWDTFMSTMAENCTMFFPFTPERANSRAEIAKVLKPLFERLKQRKATGPYLNLTPTQMHVQMMGTHAAVVTWHLDRSRDLGRRTAVLQNEDDQWLIVSFHASNFQKPKESASKA